MSKNANSMENHGNSKNVQTQNKATAKNGKSTNGKSVNTKNCRSAYSDEASDKEKDEF